MLNEKAAAYLAERAVPIEAASGAGYSVVDNAAVLDQSFFGREAMVLPYYNWDNTPTGFGRIRYFDPPIVGGFKKKSIRYQQPKGTAPAVYLPPINGHAWQHTLSNPEMNLIITEGEVKALSVMWNTGIPTMGLGGVFMWADNKQPIDLFEQIQWTRRHVYIVFDSDIDSKIGVQLAEARLAQFLLSKKAIVHTTRLPPSTDGEKQGADDFIAANGVAAFTQALQAAPALSVMDLRVLELNKEVCYLEGEEKLMDLSNGNVIKKDSFTSGSRFATLKVPQMEGKKIVERSVAQAWLTHPMARRYSNTLFVPGGDEVITEDGQLYLNSWQEQPCKEGDVTPFLELTRFLFEETLGDNWEWPIKLLAFKAQNQRRKIPLSIMLIGEQGSGKSLWSALARSAFGKYGQSRSGKDLGENWNGFLENSLLVIVDDVSVRQIRSNIETLRNWISEHRIERHEKYLKNREVDNHALLFFTTNHRDAGAFAHDDRRFLVVGAPKRDRPAEYYDPIWSWYRNGAGANLYHYLLNYDLGDWTPPIHAPMTAEKRMAYEESLSAFEMLARDMKESDVNVVQMWLANAEQWAMSVVGTPGHAETPRAQEILSSLQAFPIRPWYTAEELCNMFPHMLAELDRQTKRYSKATMPGKVSTALRNQGIYFLKNKENPAGFWYKGKVRQFLIVCPSQGFPTGLTQAEFDAYMGTFGNYKPTMRAA